MKIAILGTRGIPANYGGFETFAEELSSRLVQRGHQVTVYGRTNNVRYQGSVYKGVHLVLLPTIPHKYFDTVAHTFISVCHVLFRDADVALICNSANSIFSFIPRLAGQKTVVNVDGLEWKRGKWNALGKAYLRLSEWLSTFLPTAIVTDARAIQEYYRSRYGKESYFIPYGAEDVRVESTGALDRLGVKPDEYFLYVSRLEPENNALLVVQAFERVRTDKKLLIVGDAPYAHAYISKLKSTTDPRIQFPGAIYGQGYRELQSHAFCYIHATEVGGTHPALIEAMGCGAASFFWTRRRTARWPAMPPSPSRTRRKTSPPRSKPCCGIQNCGESAKSAPSTASASGTAGTRSPASMKNCFCDCWIRAAMAGAASEQ